MFTSNNNHQKSAISAAEPRTKIIRILLAEDDLGLAALLVSLLAAAGHDPTHAPDGAAAWKLAQEKAFDVVVLDVDMPHLTGDEVCRRIRESSAIKSTPVLLWSGRGDVAELARQAGADDGLHKPEDLPQLLEVIQRLSSAAPNQSES